MSTDHSNPPPVVQVLPIRQPSFFSTFLRVAFVLLFLASIAFNILLLIFVAGTYGDDTSGSILERHFSGDERASDKIAIVDVSGVLFEGMVGFVQKQIEHAAKDPEVKAVVLRIESPGGTITASDDLYHHLIKLRDGDKARGSSPKPLVVSMGGIAASGGYYIAMPGSKVLAEPTTLTGSIGVYAALPNVKDLGDKIGFHMEVIKAGDVKDSGSPFAVMKDNERVIWQQMVDQSYLQFLHVVEVGRPALKGKLQEDLHIDETLPVRSEKEMQKKIAFTRYRADGGIFTSSSALKFGLIDQIGYLEDAVESVRAAAKLGTSVNVVRYERHLGLLSSLLGMRQRPVGLDLDFHSLATSATPRLWYLSPGAEAAGLLAGAARQ